MKCIGLFHGLVLQCFNCISPICKLQQQSFSKSDRCNPHAANKQINQSSNTRAFQNHIRLCVSARAHILTPVTKFKGKLQDPAPRKKQMTDQNMVPKVPSVAIAFRGLDFPPSSAAGFRCLNVNPTNRLLLIGSSLSAMFSSAACLS